MGTDESYNGWTNRETWAVALYVNNDQGWQGSVFEALRGATIEDRPASLRYGNAELDAKDNAAYRARQAGEIVRENVETLLDPQQHRAEYGEQQPEALAVILYDIGSLYRVNWDELGAAFLKDLKDVDGS